MTRLEKLQALLAEEGKNNAVTMATLLEYDEAMPDLLAALQGAIDAWEGWRISDDIAGPMWRLRDAVEPFRKEIDEPSD